MQRLLSVLAATVCTVAVGVLGTGTAEAAGRWSVVTVPAPADAAGNPGVTLGVGACGSPGHCVIPGGYRTNGQGNLGLVVTVTDGVPTVVSLPAPADAQDDPTESFTNAACTSSGVCVLVGTYLSTKRQFTGVLAWGSGSDWRVVAAPATSPRQAARVLDVACGGQSCFAVGYVGYGSGPLVEKFSDGNWTPDVLPPPPGGSGGDLETVACSSASRCVAAGAHRADNEWAAPLAATWDGSSWTTSYLPPPADVANLPKRNTPQVSACAADATCHVLGPYHPEQTSVSVNFRPADYRNDDTGWTTTALPDGHPPATDVSTMSGLVCTGGDSCVAVGTEYSGSISYGVVAKLTAAGWRVTYAPSTSGSTTGVELTALNCVPSAGACTAFGLGGGPIAVRLGSTPTTTALPVPAGALGVDSASTALYDGTRQLMAATYTTRTAHNAALWARRI